MRTVKNKEIWENIIDVSTGRVSGPEFALSLNELKAEERDNIIGLKSVGQELSDAVAIAEKAAVGKAISGGLVKETWNRHAPFPRVSRRPLVRTEAISIDGDG